MRTDRRARPLGHGLAVAVALSGLAACSSGSDAAAPSATAPTSTAVPTSAGTARTTPGAPPPPSLTPSSTLPSTTSAGAPPSATTSPTRRASTSTSAGTRSTSAAAPTGTVPSVQRSTLPAAPLSSPATFGSGVEVQLAKVTAVTVVGRGPGELSGPAVAYTLRLRNRTSGALSLGAAVVSASYGSSTPADDSASSPSAPFTGTVAAGATASATYVFLVPAAQHDSVVLNVSYDPRRPVVLLKAGR